MWLAAIFFAIEFLTRLVLLIRTGDGVPAQPAGWLYLFVVGAAYDLVAFIYFAWPLVLALWLVPRRAYVSPWLRAIIALLILGLV